VDDKTMAATARNLADALKRHAKERKPETQKEVLQYQTELCAVRRQELDGERDEAERRQALDDAAALADDGR
jgi:hypothetical protein